MKECSKCKQKLPRNLFYKDKTKLDGYDNWCKDCRTQFYKKHKSIKLTLDKERRTEKYTYIKSRKTPCVKCGEDRLYVIQFHHIIPSEKRISHNLGNYSLEAIDKEIDKCICLCANCHIEFHHLYGKHPVNPTGDLKVYLGEK